MTHYGMPPIDAIRSATLEAAALLRRETELGRIASGFRADIIAVEGDPLADMTALQRIRFVMVDGKIVRDESTKTDAPAERP